MSVPADCQPVVPADLLVYEAVRLFTDRAADVLPGFTLDAGNSQPVAGVCRRLDGIPLAVELAAVRMRSLSPSNTVVPLLQHLVQFGLAGRQRAHPDCSQLDHQRDPVQSAAHPGHRLAVARIQRESGQHVRGPVSEQPHRLIHQQIRRHHRLTVGRDAHRRYGDRDLATHAEHVPGSSP